MSETLKTWFLTRLGVMIDLNPDIFGIHARDGTLMAKLLHTYDIINDSQMDTIIHTHDPALSRVNLKHLRVWLRFIGVDFDDQSIVEISEGEGSTALRIFYNIYLSLENKDRLHFITLQKEREKFIPTSTKFKVTKVSEDSPPSDPPEDPLAAPLAEKSETIQWYREKCEDIMKACKQERKRFKEAQKLKNIEKVRESKSEVKLTDSKDSELNDIDDFERKQKNKSSHNICKDPKKFMSRKNLQSNKNHLEAVEEYLKKMKKQRNKEETVMNFKQRMQTLLLSEVWNKMLEDQENTFDQIVAKKVLNESKYEKRMITKLYDIHRYKNKIAENRQIVEKITQKVREDEILLEYKQSREAKLKVEKDIEDECDRFRELQRRLRDAKIKRKKERHERTCSGIISDLIDISIKAAECLRNNDNCIPKTLWNEWKGLFIKSQPIFELAVDAQKDGEEEDEEKQEGEEIEEVTQRESKRQDSLNNFDFDSYHNIESPWDEYLPQIDEETEEILRLGLVVLGYIVHKLLEFLYPYPPDSEPAPIPKVEKRVIVLGIPEDSIQTIQDLLQHSGIKLIFMEDAINYCLAAYKEEMKDIEYISLTPKVSRESGDKEKKDSLKKSRKPYVSKMSVKDKSVIDDSKGVNKQVQTPRNIPYDDMDPNLSDDAYIGKWTHEFLKLGEPTSNELNTKILIQYLKSLTNIKGWAIVDYPGSYEQMVSLESALTGSKFPPINSDSDADDDIFSPPKIIFEDKNSDTFSVYRKSQLVPNPITRTFSEGKTFMTGFIRVLYKPKKLNEDIFEILPEDATPMDTYYADQSVSYVLYYTSFDVPTLKRLARLIIGDMSMPRKPSIELFGDALTTLEENENNPRAIPSVVKQRVPRISETSSQYSINGEGEEFTGEKSDLPIIIKPGEEGWEWVSFPQSDEILESLAILWENLESVYIANIKDIFFMKRLYLNSIVPYRTFVIKHMEEVISRPDIKQEVFKTFYREFNMVDNDLRVDSELKCELQCRVADVQSELLEICDQRKKESEEERQRMIQDYWAGIEATALINVYINLAQAEIDRCIDTIQMLQDYYNSMLQKPLGNRIPKVLLLKLEFSSDRNLQAIPKEAVKSKGAKKKNTKDNFVWEPPTAVNCRLIINEITDLLLDVQKKEYDLTKSKCYEGIKVNLDFVEGVVNSLNSSLDEIFRKEEGRKAKKGKLKKQGRPSVEVALDDNLEKYRDLLQEWRYAAMFEINRVKMRLKMLDNAVRSDIIFLLDSVRNIFHHVHKVIIDRYENEMNSVNEMASIFFSAIEEQRSIEEEMFFDGDRFVVKKICIEDPPLITEELLPFRLKMAQLGNLMDTLRHAAPEGNISRTAFFYILTDIITFREEHDELLLPSAWYKMKNSDVCQFIQELFGSDCDLIEWREFIVYGMEIPMPTTEQLLKARHDFQAFDPESKEVITREQFHSVSIWFYKSTKVDPNCIHLLHKQYISEVNQGEEATCYNFERITGIRFPSDMFKKEKECLWEEEDKSLDTSLEEFENIPLQDILRLMLAKELLSELFLIHQHFVNYMDLLFAFCKDDDPRKGLGKAISLEMGHPICTNVEDGEKYVAELLEQKRIAAELELKKKFAREEAKKISEDIIKDLMELAIQYTEGVSVKEIFEQADQVVLPERALVQTEKPHELKSDGSQKSLTKDWKFIGKYNILSKPSTLSTDLKWNDSPFISLTKIKAQNIKQPFIYWIPKEVCMKVLTARLKLFSNDPEALKSMQEKLDNVYESLWDKKLDHEKNIVLSHRLIDHDFMRVLLTNISNFTTKHMSAIVSRIVNEE